MLSVEQMVRDLLEQALKDGLVAPSMCYVDYDPQIRTAGELVGTANLLNRIIAEVVARRDARWQKAVGQSLETAERLARAETVSGGRFEGDGVTGTRADGSMKLGGEPC